MNIQYFALKPYTERAFPTARQLSNVHYISNLELRIQSHKVHVSIELFRLSLELTFLLHPINGLQPRHPVLNPQLSIHPLLQLRCIRQCSHLNQFQALEGIRISFLPHGSPALWAEEEGYFHPGLVLGFECFGLALR